MVRSKQVTLAAILVFLYSLVSTIRLFVQFVTQGEFLQNAGYGGAALLLIMSSIGMVAAYGIWQNQKWGKITAIILVTLNALLALPGIIFAPTFLGKLEPISAVVIAIIVVLLLLWRTPQSNTA